MKPFDELTKEEVANLTTDDILRYIDYDCAENGIPLLPELPPKPEKPDIKPDKKFFKIAEHTVATQEDALKIQSAFLDITVYSYSYGKKIGDLYVYEPDNSEYRDPTKITTVETLSIETYEKHKKEIEAWNRVIEEWNKISNLFQSIKKKREQTENHYWSEYNGAREWLCEKECIFTEFETYVNLADGNKEIAYKFLIKARPAVEEIYPDIKKELFNDHPEH